LLELPENDLQRIANHILSEVEPVLENVPDEDKKSVEISFINNLSLSYPKWLVNFRGHTLYSKFRDKYNNAVNHENLIKALVRHEFISADLAHIIRDIQNK
jgi:hypothetical protein